MGLATCKTSAAGADICITAYSKLSEQLNLIPSSGMTARNSTSALKFESVAVCLDCRATPVIIGALQDGALIQFRPDVYKEAGFIPEEMTGVNGHKPALGLGSDKKCHLVVIEGNEIWAISENTPGKGVFSGKRKLALPSPMSSGKPVRVMSRNLAGRLSVGVVVEYSAGLLGMCYIRDFKASSADMTAATTHQINTDNFDFALYNGTEHIVTTSGTQFILINESTAAVTYFFLSEAPGIRDIRWTPWESGNGRFFATKDDGNGCYFGEIVLESGTVQTYWYHRLSEKCRLETSAVGSGTSLEVHALLSGAKVYHSTIRGAGVTVSVSEPIAINSGGGLSQFIENRIAKSEFYMVSMEDTKLAQYIISDSGDYTGCLLSLPDLQSGKDTVVTSEGYITEIQITDTNGAPLALRPYTVWAKDEVYVETDMGIHRLGPSTSITLKTNALGTAVITQKTTGMAATDLYLTVAQLHPEPLVIKPYQSVFDAFEELTAEKLAQAKTADGEWVMPEGYRTAAAAKPILEAVQQLVGVANCGFGAETDAANAATAACGFTLGNIFDAAADVVTTYGDIAIGQENGCLVTSGVVALGRAVDIHFTMSGASMKYSGTVSNASQVMCSIESIFSSIGVGVKKLFGWLGFLFNYKDMVRVKRAVDFVYTQQITYLKSKVSYYKQKTLDVLAECEQKADDAIAGFNAFDKNKSIFAATKEKCPERSDVMAQMSGNVIFHKLIKYIDDAVLEVPSALMDDLRRNTAGLYDTLETYANGRAETIEYKAMQTFTQKYNSSASFYTVSLGAVTDAIRAAVKMVFDGLDLCVSAVFDVASALLDTLLEITNTSISIPFVSRVLKYFTGFAPTCLDINSTIIAVPGTLVYKLMFDKAPFATDAELEEFKRAYAGALTQTSNGALKKGWQNFLRVTAMISETVSWLLNGYNDSKGSKSVAQEESGGENTEVDKSWSLDKTTIGILTMDFITLGCTVPWIYDDDPEWKDLVPYIYDGFFFILDMGVSLYVESYLNRSVPGLVITCVRGVLRLAMTIVLMRVYPFALKDFPDQLHSILVSVDEAIKPLLRVKMPWEVIPMVADIVMAPMTVCTGVTGIVLNNV